MRQLGSSSGHGDPFLRGSEGRRLAGGRRLVRSGRVLSRRRRRIGTGRSGPSVAGGSTGRVRAGGRRRIGRGVEGPPSLADRTGPGPGSPAARSGSSPSGRLRRDIRIAGRSGTRRRIRGGLRSGLLSGPEPPGCHTDPEPEADDDPDAHTAHSRADPRLAILRSPGPEPAGSDPHTLDVVDSDPDARRSADAAAAGEPPDQGRAPDDEPAADPGQPRRPVRAARSVLVAAICSPGTRARGPLRRRPAYPTRRRGRLGGGAAAGTGRNRRATERGPGRGARCRTARPVPTPPDERSMAAGGPGVRSARGRRDRARWPNCQRSAPVHAGSARIRTAYRAGEPAPGRPSARCLPRRAQRSAPRSPISSRRRRRGGRGGRLTTP